MKVLFLVASLFVAATLGNEHDADRELHPWNGFRGGGRGDGGRGGGPGGRGGRGGRGHGNRPQGDTDISELCGAPIACNLKVRGSPGTVVEGGGMRICRQSPRDETRFRSVCVNSTELGFSTDTCGCCDEDGAAMDCPDTCSEQGPTCECERMDRDGEPLYTGVEVEMTRRHWWGGTGTITKCVSDEFTVDAQLHGGVCVTSCDD